MLQFLDVKAEARLKHPSKDTLSRKLRSVRIALISPSAGKLLMITYGDTEITKENDGWMD